MSVCRLARFAQPTTSAGFCERYSDRTHSLPVSVNATGKDQRVRRHLLVEAVRNPAQGRIYAPPHEPRLQRRGPSQLERDAIASGPGRIALQRHAASFGKMPEDLDVMNRCATNLIRDADEPCGTLIGDFAAMSHRIVQTAIAIVLRDDPLLVCAQIECEAARDGAAVPQKCPARHR